ncbi:ATP-binding region ATPase domain protein (plasmid) [Scytonema sp. HK-05]|uniref:AAA family ATPase n=1 Tax=Scytonema sp. HK-05 TaxID=1137095 RepID=UPI00093639DF|nr:AAA family ATPase [Scytonema sp. HK-05]OKH58173.1 serine/threonine protein kinase [Scytonema sp. HK-05]BAY50526.1 ATP-binding region ATPase domain protein [Scytonema sp. HK-05]
MISIPHITVTTKIYESANSVVYRGIREQDNTAVILKMLKEDYPTPSQLTRYKQEYEITHSLNISGVVKAYNLQEYQRTLVIILEDFGGESLEKLIQESPFGYDSMPLPEFLSIALKITEILSQIHAANIIHKDINPGNIVSNPETGIVKIIDFGISTQLSRTHPNFKNPNILEGTLAYMSPEQTGRMNRMLDYRTDFYSLGVTFYKLLTGQLPFVTNDVLELVHCHIARQPVSPHEVNSKIPEVVSAIVMKLMAKNAEERYQSTWGIKADLSECLTQLQASGTISGFPLGTQDISDKFQIPQKLYGREAEVETLLAAFERVAAGRSGRQGERETSQNSGIEMMLVAGYSGIGKSALVQEIYKPITQKRGYFISGKFDQFQRNIPYSAIVSAFAGLVRQLLSESEVQLQQWRARILAALGVNGQVIIDVIPEVELIIGKQPAVPEVGSTESQNRFNIVFEKFIRVFCRKEHPLVIFLDDLQWVDSATLKLIQLMMTDSESQYLFLIGAYRDNEVNRNHPLMMTLEGLIKERVDINQIRLAPLKQEHISHLIADTLYSDTSTSLPLSELLLRKTGGNPFFVNEFLKTLYAENLITFTLPENLQLEFEIKNPQSNSLLSFHGEFPKEKRKRSLQNRKWYWELAQIEAKDITDNVVELMISKLKKLPDATQQVLRLAACVGAEFDLNTLAIICEKSPRGTFLDLAAALHSGLISPISELDEDLLIQNYKFLHDRVQQAAYALVEESQNQAIHLQIGSLLLHNSKPETLLDKIFKIADHLNLGIKLVTEQEKRDEIAKLNLMAGQKAKAATAYDAAKRYLTTAIELLPLNSWQRQYDLTLALHESAAEAAYLCGHFEEMERWVNVVLQQAKTILDKVKAYEVKLQTCMAQSQPLKAVNTGLQVLQQLGISFPEAPSHSDIYLEIDTITSLLSKKPIGDLLHLPEMTEPDKLVAMRILLRIIIAAHIAAPDLMPLFASKQVNLSIQYGNAFVSPFVYAIFGSILCGRVGNIEFGYQFGQLALKLLSQPNTHLLRARTLHLVNYFIIHWKEHVRESLEPLLEGYQSGLEIGDLEFAAYCAHGYCFQAFVVGKELVELEREMTTYSEAIRQIKEKIPLTWLQLLQQYVLNLMGCSVNPTRLIGESYNEENEQPQHEIDGTVTFLVHFNKLLLCYLFSEYSQAVENSIITESHLIQAIGCPLEPLYYLYDSLAKLATYPSYSTQTQEEILKKVALSQEKMKQWAHYAPMNYLHKYNLVQAETARVLGQLLEAEEFYEQAIQGARENGYIQEEALAYELAAKFYLFRGREKIAQTYMKEAHYCYDRWGATAKVRDLETRYPQFFPQPSGMAHTPIHTASRTTSSSSDSALDLATVMKASQAISGEIFLDKLLSSLMKILIENVGAQTGFLILDKAGKLVIEASGEVDSNARSGKSGTIKVLQSIPIDNRLPASVINYVVRTKESVVLNDATREGNFTLDPYIKEHQTKSILCVPLVNQGHLGGVVYLENNLITNAFTPARLEVLKLLSSQAAISIENARLYTDLESANITLEAKVEQRTLELQEKNLHLQKAEDAAQSANRAKNEFLANMNHELRTPLNGILGYTQILKRDKSLSGSQKDSLNIIYQCSNHLLNLINDILDLSKIEARKMELYPSHFRFPEFIKEITEICHIRAEEKGIFLIYEPLTPLPMGVQGDEKRLRQVLINLLGNAVKFTEIGRVTFKVGYYDGKMRFQVEDTGIGIATEQLEKIFLPFHQVEYHSHKIEGTGLGLTISRQLVQMMGGDLKVKSTLGKGSVFFFELDLAEVEQPTYVNQGEQRTIIGYKGEKRKVLVADDKWENRSVLVGMLQPLGFEIASATDGQDCLNKARELKPDVILMDLKMPIMSGLEATRQIRQLQLNVAVIATSSSVFDFEQQKSFEAGCNDFLSKPILLEELLEKLRLYLKLEWIYEETNVAQASNTLATQRLETKPLVAPPPEEIAVLFDLAVIGDLKGIVQLAEHLELNEEWIPFASHLRQLAKGFKELQLQEFIKQYRRE